MDANDTILFFFSQKIQIYIIYLSENITPIYTTNRLQSGVQKSVAEVQLTCMVGPIIWMFKLGYFLWSWDGFETFTWKSILIHFNQYIHKVVEQQIY